MKIIDLSFNVEPNLSEPMSIKKQDHIQGALNLEEK